MSCYESKTETRKRKRERRLLPMRVKFGQLQEAAEGANSDLFPKYKVRQAEEMVKRAAEIFGEKMAVAFSGGKDSLVALDVARRVAPGVAVVFNDTGAEFPETLRYVERLKEEWGLNLVTTHRARLFGEVRRRGVGDPRGEVVLPALQGGAGGGVAQEVGDEG